MLWVGRAIGHILWAWAWVGLKCPDPSLMLNHPGVSLKLGRNVFATTVIFVYNVALLFIGLLRRRVSYILNNFSCIAKVIKSSFSRKKPRLWENGELNFFFSTLCSLDKQLFDIYKMLSALEGGSKERQFWQKYVRKKSPVTHVRILGHSEKMSGSPLNYDFMISSTQWTRAVFWIKTKKKLEFRPILKRRG